MASNRPLTTSELRAHIDRLPRYLLGHYPTPLEFCPRLTASLKGPQIFIKRDDCTGLAMGGNKTRHNEFLIADALKQGADLLVWGAGVQSNNCRQTAAACARAGLDIHLILGRGKPQNEPDEIQGNLLLDYLVGAKVDIVEEMIGPALDARISQEASDYRQRGRKVYGWDKAVCKPLAAVSYAICVAEIIEQAISPQAMYVSSAGSTGAGVVLGQKALGLDCLVRSVAPICWPWDTQADMAEISQKAGELVGLDLRIQRADIDVSFDFIGPGYGVVSEQGMEAIELVARTEGILLDPMYSGKAMAGMISDIRAGKFSTNDRVVFIHTGGTPALFAHHDEISAMMHPREFTPRP